MRRRLSRIVLLLISLTGIAQPAARAEVIISEIMYNPQGTDLDTTVTPNIYREWIELYNSGSSVVDIGGWQIGDSQDGDYADPFPAGTLIPPLQALVVTGDAASFDAEWGTGINRVQVSNFPSLANTPSPTNETIAIRDVSSVFRDFVNIDDANGWPRVNGSDGQSIFLLPGALNSTANNIGTNWKPSIFGVYGAKFRSADGENHGSPGFVSTVPQTPFMPSPDAAWSMVVLPDTQNYAKSSVDKGIFTQLTQWIRDNRDAYKIQAVLQEGDIVNNNNTNNPTSGDQTGTQQWQNAQASMFVLNGFVPYIMAAGNHDFGFTNADNRDTMINNYFKPTDNPLVDPAQGGILKGEMTAGDIQNAYYAFTAPDGRKMLVFSLEWEPRPATVAWANQIAGLPQYADYSAVLLTHNYLGSGGTRSTSTNVAADYSGEELWQGFVKQHDNFELVFNGHFGGDGVAYLKSTATAGNSVHQMFFNTQFETFGGDGWLRVVEFLQDGKTVRVRTYSPYHDLYRTSSDFEFEFEMSSIDFLAGDFNRDGVVDSADYIVWRDTNGKTGFFAADGNGDHLVNQLDYAIWRQHYGDVQGGTGSAQAAVVPEPGTAPLLKVAAVGLALTIVGHRSNRRDRPSRIGSLVLLTCIGYPTNDYQSQCFGASRYVCVRVIGLRATHHRSSRRVARRAGEYDCLVQAGDRAGSRRL